MGKTFCYCLFFIIIGISNLTMTVVKFKAVLLSSRLEGGTVNGITIRTFVRPLSERSPIVLGETKQMLDWNGFSTDFDDLRFIKVPIWNNDKIIGHLSLSYAFSKTPVIQKYEDHFPIKHVENIIDVDNNEKECELTTANISKSVVSAIKKNAEDIEDKTTYQIKDHIYNRFYPSQVNENINEGQLFLDKRPNKETKEKETQLFLDGLPNKGPTKGTKEKETQTNFRVRQFNQSVQTLVKTFNVAVQVDCDELEDPLDKTICCDVQNIFRCTHEFTFHIEKKCNSTFDYVTYQFPECVTTNTGKVITCHRMLRTFGNTNILHLITLPTTVSLESYFYNNYRRSAIVLNLHQNNDYLPGKISLLVSHMIEMADKFKTSHITKNVNLNNNSSMHELPHDNIHIKIHYRRVYHTFPSPGKQFKNSCGTHKSLKKNSNLIVDLTESESDETSINKTYTLFKRNNKFDDLTIENSTQTDLLPVKISHSCTTQTEKIMKEPCTTYDCCSSTGKKSENTAQIISTVITENQPNQINTKIRELNTVSGIFDENNIFKAKMIIVGGYNLPMVKLNGDIGPSAPTSYVILDNFIGINLSTSSVVQKVNPIWNSEWTLIIPKNELIEGKWLILELWCKKYKNEYAGHDAKRDIRLGYIFIDLYALEYNFNQAGGLYDVISETEEHHGKIKVLFSLINNNKSQINVNHESQPINESTTDKTKIRNLGKSNNNMINEMIGSLQIENNHINAKKYENPMTVKNEKNYEYVDLTEDSPQKCSQNSLKNIFSESCLKNSSIHYDNRSAMETISSVNSWTSSSDDILCSNNNSRTVNNILSNKTKMNRIKQIIQG